MATKSKKSSSAATSTTSIELSSEPATSTPTHHSRPVSPARLSRIQERNELQHLNDRLASYIDKVRNLENENSKLKVQIQKTSQSREIHSIKELYETELGDTRNSLDAIAKEKAQLELLLSRAQEDLKTVENRYNKKLTENVNLNKKIISIETQVEDLKNRINQGVAERKKLEGDIRLVNDDNKTLEDKLKSLKKQLEEETILRVDLENRNQSLNEELQFQRQLYNKELEEVRSKEYEVKETYSESLKKEYEQQLANELKELRADTENRIAYYRQEMEDKYEIQIGALQDEIERKNATINATNTKIKQLNSTYNFVHSEIDQLKTENHNLKDKVADLNKLVEQERDWSKASLDRKEEEINELKDKLDVLLEEYKDLVDEKIKIDAELAVYRKLLEGEETRLNISPQVSTSSVIHSASSSSTPYSSKSFVPRGNKRKRICLQEEENLVDVAVTSNAKGEIEVSEHDQDGKYVKLYNKSDKEVSLGGWQLLRTTDDLETRYKFHRSIVIKPDSTITVWSSDANAFHSPPNDIVMKAQTWFTADTMTTALFNMNGEEVASRKTEKRITSYSQRLSQGYLNSETDAEGQQKCLIM